MYGIATGSADPTGPRGRSYSACAEWGVPFADLARRSVVRRIGGTQLALLRQVHGTRIIERSAHEAATGTRPDGDAQWTRDNDLVLAVMVADCCPVALWSDERVAIVHAGWRGTADGIVPAALDAFDEPVRGAWVGPCASGTHYEVGPEVAARFARFDDAVADRDGRLFLDLATVIERQLRRGGVATIRVSARRTIRDGDLHSWRRDGHASGRMMAFVCRSGRGGDAPATAEERWIDDARGEDV